MARSRKTKSLVLTPQPDPKAPLDPSQFLSVAQGVLDQLTADLLARADESPAITAGLKARHAHDKQQGLTADGYPVWRRAVIVQIAAAWLLSCVFVRTLEDRGLLARNRLAGPGALDSERAFAKLAPHLGLREYLLTLFTELEHLPAARRLFDREHNLAWRLAPSPEGAKALVDLFRSGDPEMPHFRFGQPSTRFLGDLYQDLSEEVRKRYALLQTPEFVEQFILDRTLEPAIAEFGLPATTIIDPTCGSGHFLLGAFERLFNHWCEAEPGETNAIHVDKALWAVHGVDINPYAVSIAQFRLTLAAIDKLGVERLRDCPELPLNVVVADSLLHNYVRGQAGFGDLLGQEASAWYGEEWKLEDGDAAKRTLARGFAAVVGNPPYIAVKDKALREKYRSMYKSAAGRYTLCAPFAERFFQLAGEGGFVGQINSNAFMTREWGKSLITEVLPQYDLTSIVNTSGNAEIPGHGTPTVILFGRNRTPRGDKVHAVLTRRGEPTTPADPAQGLVWSSIRDHADDDGYEDEYVTVTQLSRESLAQHPWSLEGGNAIALKTLLEERAKTTLGILAEDVGFASFPGLDDVFLLPPGTAQRLGIDSALVRPIVVGETVRDWTFACMEEALCPYSSDLHDPLPIESHSSFGHYMWPFRTTASSVSSFGGKTRAEEGQDWWTWYRWQTQRYRAKYRITFAEVATHNHFVLDRGGKVFKQTAPIIKLPADATEDDHLALLAYLNSSTACFWMKQVTYPKATAVGDISTEKGRPEANRHQFAGTALKPLPLPPAFRDEAINLARELETLAGQHAKCGSDTCVHLILKGSSAESAVATVESERSQTLQKMVALQEQLDWLIYHAFGLTESLIDIPDELAPDERWFVSKDAARWPEIAAAVKANEFLSTLEDPRFKRLWLGRQGVFGHGSKTLREETEEAAIARTLSVVETQLEQSGEIKPTSDLRDLIARDQPTQRLLTALELELDKSMLDAESVPFLAALRLTESGLEKHAQWRHTWTLQRRQDAGEKVGKIPVPPKYDQKDFRDATAWRLRGKLDVPKERFISYPLCESDEDPQPLYGWAGWNHAQRAEALLTLYNQRRQEEAWPAERLIPILAGVHELLPWLKQWHNEADQETGERLGDAYDSWLSEELRELGLTRDDLERWRPPSKTRRGRNSSSPAKSAEPKPAKQTSKRSGKKSGRKKTSAD